MNTENIVKRLSMWTAVVAAVLMIPFVTKMPWTGSDYFFAGVVLFACAAAYVFATQNMSDINHRLTVGVAVLLFIFMVIGWAATGP